MPRYDFECPKCKTTFEAFTKKRPGEKGYADAKCPDCKIRSVRQLALIAPRPPWNPTVSYRYGDKPVIVDSRDHHRQLLRERGLVDERQTVPTVDYYAKKLHMEERAKKLKEIREGKKGIVLPKAGSYVREMPVDPVYKAKRRQRIIEVQKMRAAGKRLTTTLQTIGPDYRPKTWSKRPSLTEV